MTAVQTAPELDESQDAQALLRSFARENDRGRALRAQLQSRFPDRSSEEIEDAVQTACRYFLDEAEGISTPGQAYSWIRTAAHHAMIRELERQRRVIAVDPAKGALEAAEAGDPGPAEELIALEDEAELGVLIREVGASLSERRRQILALWGAGLKRPEIAERLDVSERSVKRDLLAIMEEARITLAHLEGGGCESGEQLVLRFAYGLASTAEAAQAQEHLHRCGRCAAFSERLDLWREKAAALFPPAAVEATNPGVVERITHRVADGFSAAKQQVLGGGTELKQQATAAYVRAADPTPIAGFRPGAVAAVIAGCIAVGGGAAYCAQSGVDPLGAAKDLIAGTDQTEQPAMPPPVEEPVQDPVSPTPTVTEETSPPAESFPPPAEEAPPSKPEPEPAPEPPPPPPEASFEPSSPTYPTEAPPEVASAPAPSPEPAPAQPGPQFGGP